MCWFTFQKTGCEWLLIRTSPAQYLEEHDSVKHVWLLEGTEIIGESLEVQGIPTTIQHHMYPYRPLQGISNHEVNFIWDQPQLPIYPLPYSTSSVTCATSISDRSSLFNPSRVSSENRVDKSGTCDRWSFLQILQTNPGFQMHSAQKDMTLVFAHNLPTTRFFATSFKRLTRISHQFP